MLSIYGGAKGLGLDKFQLGNSVQNSNSGKQTIHNRYPNETQSGKEFEYNVSDGKLQIRDGINEVDFVVDMDGNLHIGRGHSYLANGMDVQAAGTLKVNNNGQIRKITNASGHYAPTVSQGQNYPSILNDVGLSTKNAWLILGDYHLTSSGYVDIGNTIYYSQKLTE